MDSPIWTLNIVEFISKIADVTNEEIAEIPATNIAFLILSDGSQTNKTGTDMELVYVRAVKDGLPIYYCCGLQDLAEHDGAVAESVRKAIDSVFTSKLKVNSDS